MLDSKTLSKALTGFIGSESKTANAMTLMDEVPVESVNLQEIIGDPDTNPLSWSAQTTPSTGETLQNDPRSPLNGDEAFFSGLFDGARFCDRRGEWWDIISYEFEGGVHIRNALYSRIQAIVSIQDIRRSIHSWIQPFQQRVPPLAAGVDYGVLDTRVVE
jgi:hypothetical protein